MQGEETSRTLPQSYLQLLSFSCRRVLWPINMVIPPTERTLHGERGESYGSSEYSACKIRPPLETAVATLYPTLPCSNSAPLSRNDTVSRGNNCRLHFWGTKRREKQVWRRVRQNSTRIRFCPNSKLIVIKC